MSADKKADSGSTDQATETIIDVSAQISHEIVEGAKDRANELLHLPMMIVRFFANPFRFIRSAPDLKTPTWVVLTITSGVLGALVNAIVHQSVLHFVMALIILPLGAFLAVFATTSILKLIFRGAHGLRFRYRSGATIFAFSNLFWWIPIGAGEKIPPLALIGFFTALTISAVGFVDRLHLPKRLVIRWFALLGLAHTILWSIGRWASSG